MKSIEKYREPLKLGFGKRKSFNLTLSDAATLTELSAQTSAEAKKAGKIIGSHKGFYDWP